MANVYLDVSHTNQVTLKALSSTKIQLEFKNDGITVNARHDLALPYVSIYQSTGHVAEVMYPQEKVVIEEPIKKQDVEKIVKPNQILSKPPYHLFIRNVKLDNPEEHSPSELNWRCLRWLKHEMPILNDVSTGRCFIKECIKEEHGYSGVVGVELKDETVRDELVKQGKVTLGGRNCELEKDWFKVSAFRCFKCQVYDDHDTRECTSPREYCFKCTQDHRARYCEVKDAKDFKCINCIREAMPDVNHMAGTFYCPIEMKQRESQMLARANRHEEKSTVENWMNKRKSSIIA